MSPQQIHISMRSKKQHIRLWFECLQICHSQMEYSDNLKKSEKFYSEWGDVSNIKFDDWWKVNKFLFDEEIVKEVSKVSNQPNTVTLSIPLNEKISTITKEVKRIVEHLQIERLRELGIDPSNLKSKNLGGGKYSFSQKEIKGVFQYVNLEIYKIYLRLNKPPINSQFIYDVRIDFDERKRSQLKTSVVTIPTLSQFKQSRWKYEKSGDFEDQIRSVRRSIKGVENTLTNVSKGRFP